MGFSACRSLGMVGLGGVLLMVVVKGVTWSCVTEKQSGAKSGCDRVPGVCRSVSSVSP